MASNAKTDSNNFAFFIAFNPNNTNVSPLIQTAFKWLQQSFEIKECFKDIKLIKTRRQPSKNRAKYSKIKGHYSKKVLNPEALIVILLRMVVFIL